MHGLYEILIVYQGLISKMSPCHGIMIRQYSRKKCYFEMPWFVKKKWNENNLFYFSTTYRVFGTFRKPACWVKINNKNVYKYTSIYIFLKKLKVLLYTAQDCCTFWQAAYAARTVWQKILVILKPWPFRTEVYFETSNQPMTSISKQKCLMSKLRFKTRILKLHYSTFVVPSL